MIWSFIISIFLEILIFFLDIVVEAVGEVDWVWLFVVEEIVWVGVVVDTIRIVFGFCGVCIINWFFGVKVDWEIGKLIFIELLFWSWFVKRFDWFRNSKNEIFFIKIILIRYLDNRCLYRYYRILRNMLYVLFLLKKVYKIKKIYFYLFCLLENCVNVIFNFSFFFFK